jgi:hypothetical protein
MRAHRQHEVSSEKKDQRCFHPIEACVAGLLGAAAVVSFHRVEGPPTVCYISVLVHLLLVLPHIATVVWYCL